MTNYQFTQHRAAVSRTTGKDHLTRRSTLAQRLRALPPIRSVVVIDDNETEAKALLASLRLVIGHDTKLTSVRRIADARRAIDAEAPEIVFLDDRLGHSVSAELSISTLRAAGYTGRPIILSGLMTRARNIELKKLDAADIIHKDDVDAVRLMEALLRALGVSEAEIG